MAFVRRVVSSTVLVMAGLLVREAGATPNFPDALKAQLGFSTFAAAPPCLTCHVVPSGGTGTATQLFGAAVKSRGTKAYDTASLEAAVADMDKNEVDSVGDGIPDTDKLRQGLNP